MHHLLVVAAAALTPTPQLMTLKRTAPSRVLPPQAVVPKWVILPFCIPPFIQAGYAIEATLFPAENGPIGPISPGIFTRIVKSDFVQKGPRMKTVPKDEKPKCKAVKLPPAALDVATGFAREYPRLELEYLWGALLKSYGNQDRALAAVRSNSQILNPSYTFPNTVLESKRVLLTVMSEAEALDVMELNPGVLQCGPSLDMLGADEIRSIARARSMGNSMVPAPLRGPAIALAIGTIGLALLNAQSGGAIPELDALVTALKPLILPLVGSAAFLVLLGQVSTSGSRAEAKSR